MDRFLEKLTKDREDKVVVFTNGVFDILHKGHVDYLNSSSELGDILIIGVNSDASVKRLKGDDRPINGEDDRAFILENLKAVDRTIIFEDDTPFDLIKAIKPDILVKGGDYDADEVDRSSKRYIVGSDIVKEYGGRVITIDLTQGRSTTSIIERARSKR